MADQPSSPDRAGGVGEARGVAAVSERRVYDSSAEPPPIVGEALELTRYWELVRLLTVTGIKTRYKRSVLGVAWTLLNPLLHMLVLTLAFSELFHTSLPDYPVYVLAGLVVWNFFAQSTSSAMTSLISGGALMRQVHVPASVFPTAAVLTGLVNMVLSFAALLILALAVHHPLTPAVLFVPAAAVMLVAFSLGVALAMSALAVVFTDLVEMYGVLLRMLYFLTAIMYPVKIIPERFRILVVGNPVYILLTCFRDPIYTGHLPSARLVLAGAAIAAVTLAAGWWVFSRKAYDFVYLT